MIIERRDRIAGGLLGLLVGDAVGVPYEFHGPDQIPPLNQIEMQPPQGFRRAHSGTPTGTWSDDGAQALCLLDSLLSRGRFSANDFALTLLRWRNEGYMAVDNRVFDIGGTTSTAIRNIASGNIPALKCGPSDSHACGNGSLMRVLPLALWHTGTDSELVELAMEQSKVTHGHLRAQLCCALYCLWAREVLQGGDIECAYERARKNLYTLCDEEAQSELDFALGIPRVTGTGYVVDCLTSAYWACVQAQHCELSPQETPYEVAVKLAIALGNDTDTTACVAGGIAGLAYGVQCIPQRWLDALRGKEIVAPLLKALCGYEMSVEVAA